MTLPAHYEAAFKAYDIRGLYKENIDEMFAYLLGIAIAKRLDGKKILVWGDSRWENNDIISAFLHGIVRQGGSYDIAAFTPPAHPQGKRHHYGVSSSSVLFYVGSHDYALSVSVSASHNPAWYVWFKFFDAQTVFLKTADLQADFAAVYAEHANDDVTWETWMTIHGLHGLQGQVGDAISPLTKKNDYLTLLHEPFVSLRQSFSFCVDYSHGAGVTVEQEFLRALAEKESAHGARHEIHHLNDYADGLFPSHESDTQDQACYADVVACVGEKGLDFGVMFDGDADRIGFVDEKGQVVKGDLIYALIVWEIAQDGVSDKKTMVYDIMSRQSLKDVAEENGLDAQCIRTGRFFIQEAVLAHDALIGGESSSHFLYNVGPWQAYEVPLLSLYYVMRAIERHGSLSQAVASVTRSYAWPLQKVFPDDRDVFLAELKALFPDMSDMSIDGVNLVDDQCVIIARKSNTEPLVRIWVEAKDQALHDEIVALINTKLLS